MRALRLASRTPRRRPKLEPHVAQRDVGQAGRGPAETQGNRSGGGSPIRRLLALPNPHQEVVKGTVRRVAKVGARDPSWPGRSTDFGVPIGIERVGASGGMLAFPTTVLSVVSGGSEHAALPVYRSGATPVSHRTSVSPLAGGRLCAQRMRTRMSTQA